MAIRVDDIVVTEKNVFLLSGGRQFIADIEKNTDITDSSNYTRDRNPWNFYSSDGHIYHNLFDTSNFDIRTQVLTGSVRHSPNNRGSHESIFMPNDVEYVDNCQFYDNAYTITRFTTSTLSSFVEHGDGDVEVFKCDHGFIRYDNPSSYENPTEYFISPFVLFNPTSGVQYITEYPANGYYMDFGDNETGGRPTVFGDSVLSKYYLDQDYSVSSYDINSTLTRFRNLRTYYGIGSTGNSIYMVFRNNLYGTSTMDEENDSEIEYSNDTDLSYIGFFPLSSVAYMSNMVSMLDTDEGHENHGLFYSSDPYSDMFPFLDISEVSQNLVSVKQPEDNSFVLYVQSKERDGIKYTDFTYIPKIGLERSKYFLSVEEDFKDIDVVELPHCIAIGTSRHGILTVWSRDYLYDGKNTLVDFNPFQYACSGVPSFESLTSKIDGNIYRNIKFYYNGKDILGAKATVSNELSAYGARVAFFSSKYEDEERSYEIGQFFMPAGNPLYEIEVLSSEVLTTSKVLSSVPVSSINEKTGDTIWNFALKEIDVVTGTTIVTSDPFQVSANYVYDSDILFDYSSTFVENELEVGSYAFVQFEKYGLGKCYVGDIYSKDKMLKFSSTGPINRYDSRDRIWNRLEYPSDAFYKIKGKANTFEDLKRLPAVSGDIYSLVDAFSSDAHTSLDYAYYEYSVDGNLSSWEEASAGYVNGVIGNFQELREIQSPNAGDTYLMKSGANAGYSGFTSKVYDFFKYTVNGNLSSWELNGDNGIISGRKDKITDFPGYPGAAGSPEFDDIYFLTASRPASSELSPKSQCFYIYDYEFLKDGTESCIRKWKRLEDEDIENYIVLEGGTYEGPITFGRMMSDAGLRITGKYGILVDDGSYGGTTFSRGQFYSYNSNMTSTNGWVDVTYRVSLTGTTPDGYDFERAEYFGLFDTFEQMTHISPPRSGSMCFVIENYSRSEITYPQYTYFKYGYNDNELGWWEYNISNKISRRVKNYSDLANLSNVKEDEICLVENSFTRAASSIGNDNFVSFSKNGNTSIWEYAPTIGKIKGFVDNTSDLENIANVIEGDIYVVRNEEDFPDLYSEQHSFYEFHHDSQKNVSNWKLVNLPIEYGLPLSGYAESYGAIDNLSGNVGALYFTENHEDPDIVFYRLEQNSEIKRCTDATFSVISYGDDSKKPILEEIEYLSPDYSTYYISGKPALKSTFAKTVVVGGHEKTRYTNSFSTFPLTDRDILREPLFSTVKSEEVETTPISTFEYALDKPIENSMGVSVKTFKNDSINHDAAISLVYWNNSSGEYFSEGSTVSGLNLQYNGICTDVYMNGTVLSSENENLETLSNYSTTVYEYPHPCYGKLKTAGSGIPIFDGTLNGDDMTEDDLFFVNGYFVVKNYSVDIIEGKTKKEWDDIEKRTTGSGKYQLYDTGNYPKGGYVVTNFFADTGDGSGIPFLYKSRLVESSKEKPKTEMDSERFYDYNYLWHISPDKHIEFYPESVNGKRWTPYYPSKYVDFIKYHNGYYYISMRDRRELTNETVGYDIVETDTLFREKKLEPLEGGVVVSDLKFFDNHAAVEYRKPDGTKYIKWFDCGKSVYKVFPVMYSEDASTTDKNIRKSTLKTEEDYSSDVVASYDNVEVINSLNRFTPIVNHKSNVFSVKIEDLGFEESEYLTDYQKKILRTYFRNRITELVNTVKPANTQLFDVYMG